MRKVEDDELTLKTAKDTARKLNAKSRYVRVNPNPMKAMKAMKAMKKKNMK